MAKGFVYLVVIMQWASRAVLAWRLSNTLGADFCVEVLEEALAPHGRPAREWAGHARRRASQSRYRDSDDLCRRWHSVVVPCEYHPQAGDYFPGIYR
jgi:hypothetical protein